jgi:hypothetical protein|nr:MAG TPA: hypothetical protein [Caudoviricetes sp.]
MGEKSNNFVTYYKNQDMMKKKAIREAFLEKTSLSYPAWYSKIARRKFSVLEIDVLVKICGTVF